MALVLQRGGSNDTGVMWSGFATATVRDNMDRDQANSRAVVIGATGVMASYGIPLYAGDIVTNIAFRSGSQAAVTPTHWWFALYDVNGVLMNQTADQLTAAWALDTVKDVPLVAAQKITTSGIHYVAIMMTAATIINVLGAIMADAATGAGYVAGMQPKARTSGSALTTTAPGTIATPTNIIGVARVETH